MNEKKILHQWVWLIFSLTVILLLQFLVGILQQALSVYPGLVAEYPQVKSIFPFLLSSLALCLVAFAFSMYADKIKWTQMGWRRPCISSFAKGAFIAFALLSFSTLLLALSGQISWSFNTLEWSAISWQAASMFLIAIGEEAYFRGYLQRNLQATLPPKTALLLSALLFTLLHVGNPGKNWLALPGIFAGGLLLGVNYLYTSNIWFGIGLHFTWNFLLGSLLGMAVSGLGFQSVLVPLQHGKDWLTGGTFGLEASALSIFINLAMVFLLYKHYAPKVPAKQL